MNRVNFSFCPSKTQYDLYKYKLDEEISYSKRKLYRSKVKGKLYDLRTEDFTKYLIKVEVDKKSWEKFKLETWEHTISSLNLVDTIAMHIQGILEVNSFRKIILPEDLEELIDYKENPLSTFELEVSWFDVFTSSSSGKLNISVFHN